MSVVALTRNPRSVTLRKSDARTVGRDSLTHRKCSKDPSTFDSKSSRRKRNAIRTHDTEASNIEANERPVSDSENHRGSVDTMKQIKRRTKETEI